MIAGSYSEIELMNREELLEELKRVKEELKDTKSRLYSGDRLKHEEATELQNEKWSYERRIDEINRLLESTSPSNGNISFGTKTGY